MELAGWDWVDDMVPLHTAAANDTDGGVKVGLIILTDRVV